MPRKKIVFVIVEGPSDETALSAIFSKIFSNESVYFHIVNEDITTKNGVNPSNINVKIQKLVKKYINDNPFVKTDFAQIIHITDTDGAFIPDDHVIEDPSAKSTIHSPTEIRTKCKKNIEERNKQKSENINKLLSFKDIWKIPYQIYFMSCNLDHVLYDKLNSTDEEKEDDAYNFAKQYKDNIDAFVEFISESDFSVYDEYKKTWEFIKKDLHSLERHTNLSLCFPKNSETDITENSEIDITEK